ncbi:MAG: hypothetical protein H0T76_12290 [Nannocystis sp.]|nr:hypothetical protein [Nannocystis sp.]MBA3547256.1 hypothetical protein [Nannocystis sp.]
MHRIVIAVTALLFAVSCDSGDPTKSKGDPSAPAASTTPTAPAAAAQDKPGAAASGPFASLSECLSSCEGAGMIPTNQATCRLNCDTAYGAAATAQPAGATGPDADPVARAGECMGTCYAGSSSPEACASTCKTTAAAAASAPATDVLDTLDTCIRTCHEDKTVLPTNRRTCELNCTQRARVAATPPPGATPNKAP